MLPGALKGRWIHGREQEGLRKKKNDGMKKDDRVEVLGGGARTGSIEMKLFLSTLVSRGYRVVGNSATSFHRDETFSLSLLSISCKDSFSTNVSPY